MTRIQNSWRKANSVVIDGRRKKRLFFPIPPKLAVVLNSSSRLLADRLAAMPSKQQKRHGEVYLRAILAAPSPGDLGAPAG